uniref:Uncharacterized protein n=1 Tax=Anguilla anguilla TaxID=7936 RepID=A0A0E9SVN5_ANGAN
MIARQQVLPTRLFT